MKGEERSPEPDGGPMVVAIVFVSIWSAMMFGAGWIVGWGWL